MYGQDWINGNITRTGTGTYSFTTNGIFSPNTWVFCSASRQTVASNDGDGGGRFMLLADGSGIVTSTFRAWNALGIAADTFGFVECESGRP